MPAEPYAWQIADAILTRLATIDGSGSYHHDLTATGRVQAGDPTSIGASALPQVWLTDISVGPAEFADLGTRGVSATYRISAFAGADSAAQTDRLRSILRLASDVVLALQSGSPPGQLGLSLARPLLAVLEGAVEGAAVGYPGCMIALIRVDCTYYRAVGTGI